MVATGPAGGRFTKPPVKPYDSSYLQLTNLWEIVQRWNPDNVSMPVPFRETLAVLNYSDPHERSLAEAYRNAEVPFKIYDVPLTHWMILNMRGTRGRTST